MMPMHRWLSMLILAMLPMAALAQGPRRDARIIFKDGFFIHGKVYEATAKQIFDSASGQAISIMSGNFYIDDDVRSIMFSQAHVLKIEDHKDSAPVSKPYVRLRPFDQTKAIDSTWSVDGFGPWSDAGDRTTEVNTGTGRKSMTQRIAWMTPRFFVAPTIDYKWNMRYFTQELEPERARTFLLNLFKTLPGYKDMKPPQKFLKIAGFMQEAGWFKEAEEELVKITVNFPAEKKAAEEMLGKLRKDRAELFVESIEQARKVGQHAEALERLDNYERDDIQKIISPAYRDRARILKEDYAKEKAAIEQAREFLTEFPANTPKKALWTKVTAFMLEELNHDTVDRLEEFLQQAKQFERQSKEKQALTHNAEEVLAFGVSSWLQGNDVFEKPHVALNMVKAREFLLAYLQADTNAKRTSLLAAFKSYNKLPIDVLARLVRMIPPAEPHPAKEINTEVQAIKLDNGGTYLLQLPPDYHHQRAYPVLLVCHSEFESAEVTMKRLAEEAAKQGVILAAPLWAGKKVLRSQYQYTEKERAMAFDTLRDLRRRFQVDSDRVFLFGWGEGANMAFDVGLARPDQFAGVVPMHGTLTSFARRWYWPNAQYLPFYVIEGEFNGVTARGMRDLFKEWTRAPFQSLYVEHRGGASEWLNFEVPQFFQWMNCKKRQQPKKDLGREEFRSSRGTDNRFYWLSSETIDANCRIDHTKKAPSGYRPATFQASLSLGNLLDKSTNKEKIWNRAQVKASGMGQVTLWITPGMIDMTKPLEIFINAQAQGGMRDIQPSLDTMLQELHESGDRQRLFVAKIEIKVR